MRIERLGVVVFVDGLQTGIAGQASSSSMKQLPGYFSMKQGEWIKHDQTDLNCHPEDGI